jgi:hypothetical protein
MINDVTGAGSVEVNLTYNPSVVIPISITNSDFDWPPQDPPQKPESGHVVINAIQFDTGLNGNVKIGDITLQAVGGKGESSPLNLTDMTLLNMTMWDIPIDGVINGTFTVTGAQSWYLHNDTNMYKGDTSKPEGTVTITSGESHVWRANNPATVDVGFPAGNWTGNIMLGEGFTDTSTVEVGSCNGSNFTVYGSQMINGNGSAAYPLSISVGAFIVNIGDYLALQISSSGTDLILKTGGGDSYLTSPKTDPGYPIPEMSTFTLLSVALLALVGYSWIRRGNK